MTDVFTQQQRSEIMSKVLSSRNKTTEMRLIKFFRAQKIKGWRRNYKLFGKPDFVFAKIKCAVFADGCFWHGHDCRNTKPQANAEFWKSKIARNKKRDREVSRKLKSKGWLVVRVWECEIKDERRLARKLRRLQDLLAKYAEQ